jgi:hypothetical protein
VKAKGDLLSVTTRNIFVSQLRREQKLKSCTNKTTALSKFQKIEKEFLLSDSSVNSYGFRLLTKGYLMDEYKKNPIGYFMHGKAEEYPREKGVLVKWDDLRVDGDKVFGKPVINMAHPRAQKTIDEIENGFLNAASVGHLIVLEVSSEESDMLPNQAGPTVTKWFNRECSLVDIPGNFNALALYDKDENPINLADFTKFKKPKIHTMKKLELTGAQIAALNLKAEANDAEISAAFNDLIAKAAKVDGLQTELNARTTKVTALETEIATLKQTTSDKEVSDLIAKGIEDKKLTVEVGTELKKTYAGKPVELKNLIAAMPVYTSVASALEDDKKKGEKEYQDLAAMSGNTLMENGKMTIVKEKYPELYKAKMAEIRKEANG